MHNSILKIVIRWLHWKNMFLIWYKGSIWLLFSQKYHENEQPLFFSIKIEKKDILQSKRIFFIFTIFHIIIFCALLKILIYGTIIAFKCISAELKVLQKISWLSRFAKNPIFQFLIFFFWSSILTYAVFDQVFLTAFNLLSY